MAHTPRDLYNSLKKAGKLSVSYEVFRAKWDEVGGDISLYDKLVAKKLTKMSYEQFTKTFSDPDPEWQADVDRSSPALRAMDEEKAIAEGKGTAEGKTQEESAAEDTELSAEKSSLGSLWDKAKEVWSGSASSGPVEQPEEEVAEEDEVPKESKPQVIASPEKIANIRNNFSKRSNPELDAENLTEAKADIIQQYTDRLDNKKIESAQKDASIGIAHVIPGDAEKAARATKELDDIEEYVARLGVTEESMAEYQRTFVKGYAERFLDSALINLPVGLETAWEATKVMAIDTFSDPQIWGIPSSVELPKKVADIKNDYIISQLAKIQALSSQTEEVGGIYQGIKQGDPLEIIGGTFNAVQGLISTAIPATMTGGLSLAPQIIAPMWVDYNTTKAARKYGDHENPMQAMVDADDTDLIIPSVLGVGAYAMEKMGLKGISKYMAGSKVGTKIMSLDFNKVAWLYTNSKEGFTEWAQVGIEELNNQLAQGKNPSVAVKNAAKKMFSEDGLEAGLQGWVGSGLITAPRAIDMSVTRALHSDPHGDEIITDGIAAIAELREKRLRSKSKETHKLIDADIAAVQKQMQRLLKDNNRLIKHLTPADKKKLISKLNQKDTNTKAIDALIELREAGKISNKEAGYSIRRYTNMNKAIAADIAGIKENIDKSKIVQDIKTVKKFAKKMPDLAVDSANSTAGVQELIKDAIDDNGKPYTEAELKKFAEESAGLFWTDKDGVEHIVINESLSADAGLTTTGQHEFLHKVFNKVLKSDPKLAKKLGDALTTSLHKLFAEGEGSAQVITDEKGNATTRYEARLKEYEADGEAIHSEEKLTLLSEALANKEIVLNEENRNFLGKVSELIRRTFLDLGITTVNLDDDGVLQFIKDYNREYKRGKLSRSTKQVMKGDAKFETETVKKGYKPEVEISKPSNIKKSLDTAQKIDWEISKNDLSWEDIYDEDGEQIMSSTDYKSNLFEVNGQKYRMAMHGMEAGFDPIFQTAPHLKNVVELDFGYKAKKGFSVEVLNNSRNALKVLGVVVNGAKQAIEKFGVDGITFTGVEESARVRVYAAITKVMAREYGWTHKIRVNEGTSRTQPNTVFALYKPKNGAKPKATRIKQSKAEEKDLYEKTNTLYKEFGEDKNTAGFMIGMEWENQIKSLAKKYRDLPGYNEESIEDLVATVQSSGSQSILGLVNSYKEGKTDHKGEPVTLPYYINMWLPKYVNGALHGVGIGEIEVEYDMDGNEIQGSGFMANVEDLKDLTSSEDADALVNQEEETDNQIARRHPSLSETLKLGENKDITDYLTERIQRNISSNISKFGEAKSKHVKQDKFVLAVKKGIMSDENSAGIVKKYILDYGWDKFLIDNKLSILANYSTTNLSKHPFYKQAIQKRVNGKWQSPVWIFDPNMGEEGRMVWDWTDNDGNLLPKRSPAYEREKTAAGHIVMRRNPKLDYIISDNAWVDYHYADGAKRKRKKGATLTAMAEQISAETGFELLRDQLIERKGSIYDVFQSRVSLTQDMTAEEKTAAIEKGLIVREGLREAESAILTEIAITETLKDLDRGGVKQSKVNKTGNAWFDKPRINMTNYLANLGSNQMREAVVNGEQEDPEYDQLLGELKEAYESYLFMLDYQADWTDTQAGYAKAFQEKGYKDFAEFMQNTLDQTTNTVEGTLGLVPGSLSFGKKNQGQVAATKKQGVDQYITTRLNASTETDKAPMLADIIKTLIGATSGSANTALYNNTPGFYKEVVEPMVNAYGIKPGVFELVETEDGTTITYKGKKITTDFSRGVFSEDAFDMFDDLTTANNNVANSFNVEGRIVESIKSGELYLDYISYLRDSRELLSPAAIGQMLKGFQARNRSIAVQMHPIVKVMLFAENKGAEGYTTIPEIPAKYVSQVALNYIITGKNYNELERVVKEGTTAILPKEYAKVVDQFHYDSPENSFDSEKVKSKLHELNLPPINTTDLRSTEVVPVTATDRISNGIKQAKVLEAFGNYQNVNKKQKPITVINYDELSKKSKVNLKNAKDVHIISSNPDVSANAIQAWAKSNNIDVKLTDISLLKDNSNRSKSDWVLDKIAKGFNDFSFEGKSVNKLSLVKEMIKDNDIKSPLVKRNIKQSKGTAGKFSDMITKATGFDSKLDSGIAQVLGAKEDSKLFNKVKIFGRPEAEDFLGLMYQLLGKGKQGDADLDLIRKTLIEPYVRGISSLDRIRTQVSFDFKTLKDKNPEIADNLHTRIDKNEPWTYDQALRYYLYNKAGYSDALDDIEGTEGGIKGFVNVDNNGTKAKLPARAFTGPSAEKLAERGITVIPDTPAGIMIHAIISDPKMLKFANDVGAATKLKEGYIKPSKNWLSRGSLATDFHELVGKEYRASALKGFSGNVELVFTPQNLNKIEAKFGINFRKALFNVSQTNPGAVQRMIGGRGSMKSPTKIVNWLNGAIAPIMFINKKSALLQLISFANFYNTTDNNPLAASQLLAGNPKQFWKDFMYILNSPKLIERRAGLKYSVEEAEFANVGGRQGAWEVFKAKTIKLGFYPTQQADSFAIAFGGAAFYRNRVKTYLGMLDADGNKKYTEKQAEEQAWTDFSETADTAQQSSDQMLLSAEQTGSLGRVILAFANTPQQYTRIITKAARDIRYGRGDFKTNVGKIAYYGALQNALFTALQNAVFMGWDLIDGGDEEEEAVEKDFYAEKLDLYSNKRNKSGRLTYKPSRAKTKAQEDLDAYIKERDDKKKEGEHHILTSMLETIMRGAGVYGASIMAMAKTAAAMKEGLEKEGPMDTGPAIIAASSISPPLNARARYVRKGMTVEKYNKEVIDSIGWRWDSPRWVSTAAVSEGITNLPVNWFAKQAEIVKLTFVDVNEATRGEKALINLGWNPYAIGVQDEEFKQIKIKARADKKERKAAERKSEAETDKQLEKQRLLKRTPKEIATDKAKAAKKQKETTRKSKETRKANKKASDIARWKKARGMDYISEDIQD